jgi:hypothetical protein
LEFGQFIDRWVAIERHREFGLAQIAWMIAETHRDSAKRSKPFQVAEFMLSMRGATPEKTKEQEAAEMLVQVEVLNQLFGGKDLRARKAIEGAAA